MKNPKKITRVQLSINEDDEPFVFGIVSSDPDYKLSLKLNNKLGVSLKNILPVETGNPEEKVELFSRFSDTSNSPDSSLFLVSNRSGNNFLIRKLKNIDFILVIHDHVNIYSQEIITEKIKEIDSVTAVFRIILKTINDRNQHLLFQ